MYHTGVQLQYQLRGAILFHVYHVIRGREGNPAYEVLISVYRYHVNFMYHRCA